MTKFAQGIFTLKNPQKYIGKHPVRFRSSWENSVMMVLDSDNNPNCLFWASESISIPYRNPLTGKWSMYIPDLLIIYLDKQNKKHCEIIEIKPEKEMPGYVGKVSSRTKLVQAVNAAKWQAALAYCVKRNWVFRVMTERDAFGFKRKQ